LACLIIIPAAIFIAVAAINSYEPIAKPQITVRVPWELMVSVNSPMSGDDDISEAISVTCRGICCPPPMKLANGVMSPASETMI